MSQGSTFSLPRAYLNYKAGVYGYSDMPKRKMILSLRHNSLFNIDHFIWFQLVSLRVIVEYYLARVESVLSWKEQMKASVD